MTTDPVLLDLLAAVDARRTLLARAAAVLRAIDSALGSRYFICAELRDYAALPLAQPLREAITAAVGSMNLRKLGWLFVDIEGVALGGLEIHRLDDGADRHGAIWQVVAARFSGENPH